MSADGQGAEVVVARLRPHGRAMFWPCVALILIVAAAGYFYGWFPEVWENAGVLAGAVLLIILLVLLPLLSWLGHNYTITTRRLVLRRGFLTRVRQELLHSRGYDVTVRKHALQSLFRSGDVLINTGLDTPVVLHDVPDADLVQATLHDLMESSQNFVSARRQQEASRPDDDTIVWGRR